MTRIFAFLLVVGTVTPASAYDPAKVEALRGAMALAALCLEKYGDRGTFEIVFDRLTVANTGNPDPLSRVELQGARDGAVSGAREADLSKVKDAELRPICQTIRNDPDEW